jgi:predicted acetyltransferase
MKGTIMANISIRPLQGEEYIDVLFNFQMYAFRASPPFMEKEGWANIVRQRKGVTYHVLFEQDVPVAAAANTFMTQNVRGKLFPAGGVWGVVTQPAARRKGYSRQILGSLLSTVKEAGAVFSNLYPFRESFYERMGYVTFPLPIIAHLSTQSLAPLLKMELEGEVELKLMGEAYETYRSFLVDLRSRVHGMTVFDFGEPAIASQNGFWVALAKVDGEIEGMMLYKLVGEEIARFNFRASRFYYTTPRGKYLLLDWIARHIDQADRAEIWLPPYEHPETWLADLQVRIESQDRAPMSRILDVANISGMETGSGSFSALITDPLLHFNEGNWKFESIGGCLQVSRAEEADCELTIQGLTALVFGTHDPQDFSLRGWGDPTPEIQAVMRSMFPPRITFLHENF